MKNKRLLSLIALLLIASLLLAACSGPDDDGEHKPSDDPFEDVTYSYAEAAEKWAEYISYSEPEADTAYTATELLSDLAEKGNLVGDLLVVTETEKVYVTPEAAPADPGDGTGDPTDPPAEPEPILTETVTTTKWYNVNTGELVRTFEGRMPKVNADNKVHESIDFLNTCHYQMIYADHSGLIRVEVGTVALNEVDPPAEGDEPIVLDPLDVNNYSPVVSYSYYFKDGTEFKTGLKDTIDMRLVSNPAAAERGRFLLDSEELGKTFLIEDNKVVREFEYMMEYEIPAYDEDSHNALILDDYDIITGIGPYAYFEKGGNKYLVTEAMPIMQPMGDLVLFLVPGMTISVTDANDKALATYTSECYGISGYAVLSNGNVYVCEYELLNKDATEYDIKSGEDKLNVNHKLISITDGSVTNLDLSFAASKIFNDTTKDIRSFINFTTLEVTDFNDADSALLADADVKDGFMIASIQKYSEGMLDPNTTFAVLNESLEIVAELPKIIPNQFTYPSFIDADTLVVSTRTANNHVTYYAIDTENGKPAVLPALKELVAIDPITNGYIWWQGESCKVYDSDWKLVKDFTKDDNSSSYECLEFRIINGALYYDYAYNSGSTHNSTVRKLTISEVPDYNTTWYENGQECHPMKLEMSDVDFLSSAESSDYEGMLISDDVTDAGYCYYNANGEKLLELGNDARYKSVHDEELDVYVHYYGDAFVDTITETEAGYLVCLRIDWAQNSSSSSDMPEEFTEYEYIVIK